MFVQEQRFVLGFPKQSTHDVTKVNEISTCQSQQGDKQKTKRVRELLHLSTDDTVLLMRPPTLVLLYTSVLVDNVQRHSLPLFSLSFTMSKHIAI